jgi:hypothetical protein
MENLGIFYDHLVYFTAIGNILWKFSIFCGHLVYLFPFWYVAPIKIWQPCCSDNPSCARQRFCFATVNAMHANAIHSEEKPFNPFCNSDHFLPYLLCMFI